MMSKSIGSLLAGLVLAGASGVALGGDFTAEGQSHEPVPTGHVVGKDNFPSTHPNRFHMTGEDCGICHAPGRKGGSADFTMSGTIYTDRTGRQALEGAEIILKDASGKVISMTSNAVGNFFTKESITSDPAGWNATKTDAENQADPGTWRYKAWVKKGDYVSPMMTVAPVGGMSVPRMSCSMHHAPGGSRGALNVGGVSTLPSYPASDLSYAKHVQPILKNRCKSCHVPTASGGTATYPTGVNFAYNGNLDLSRYCSKTGSTNVAMCDASSRDKGIKDIVNTVNPDASAILTSVIAGSSHAGGSFWQTSAADYKAIRQWIAEGAKNN